MQWEQEVAESKYAAGLEQLEEGLGRWGRKIPADASLWQCDETGTKDNLWLNLGTGFIGSGRQAGTAACCSTRLLLKAPAARDICKMAGIPVRLIQAGVAVPGATPYAGWGVFKHVHRAGIGAGLR